MSSTKQFERLIDLIINEDQEKAQALFHDIVVEKSREIYESIMAEEGGMVGGMIDEISSEEDGMEGMMEDDDEFVDDEEIDGDFDVDVDDEMDDGETEVDIDVDDMEGEEGEAELEDRVVDLEDKLDELMAEFEDMMGDSGESDAEFDDEAEEAGEDLTHDLEDEHDDEEAMMEAIELKKIPGLYDSKISSDYADGSKKGPVDANSGQKGMASRPVKFSDGGTATASGTKAPSVSNYGTKGEKDVDGAAKWQNRPAQSPTIAKTGKGENAGMQYGDAKSKAQGKAAGAGGETIKQDNKSVIESRRTTKRRI